MTVFGNYARYYDILYGDKDYTGEARFVSELLAAHAPGTESILDLGCGSGRHAVELARLGYRITGIDISEEMLALASQRRRNLVAPLLERIEFRREDIRNLNLNRTYDAVLLLFHVLSYQTTNDDLSNVIASAQTHLRPDGALLFDCWYGPAVLHQKPERRERHLTKNGRSFVRIAEPILHPNENLVEVRYHVVGTGDGGDEEVTEVHRMRYLFVPELEALLGQNGLVVVEMGEWLSRRPPGLDTWSVYFVARQRVAGGA